MKANHNQVSHPYISCIAISYGSKILNISEKRYVTSYNIDFIL